MSQTTRTRSQGSVTANTSRTDSTTKVTGGSFKASGSYSALAVGSHAAYSTIQEGYSDTRESITDSIGSPGVVHSCSHVKKSGKNCGYRSTPFRVVLQSNVAGHIGQATYETVLDLCSNVLSTRFGVTHASTTDASALALSRVPNTSPEVMRCVVSIIELGDFRRAAETTLRGVLGLTRRTKSVMFNGRTYDWGRLPTAIARVVEETFTGYMRTHSRAPNPVGLLRKLVDMDLGWKFAINPLLGDINRTHSTFGRWQSRVDQLVARPVTLRGRAASTGSVSTPIYTNSPRGNTGILVREDATLTKETTKEWVYGVTKRLNPDALPSLDALRWAEARERLGLNLRVSDAWQLVPLSFVLDWFIPIQDFLDQFVVPDREIAGWFTAESAWSSVSQTTQYVVNSYIRHVQPTGTSPCAVVEQSGQNRECRQTYRSYTRTALAALPGIEDVPLYLPTFGLPSRASQWVTGMELLHQTFTSDLRRSRR